MKRLSISFLVLMFLVMGTIAVQAGWNDVNCAGNWAFDYENIDDAGNYTYEMVAQADSEYNIIYYWNAEKVSLTNFAIDKMDETFEAGDFSYTNGFVYIIVVTDKKRTVIEMPASYFPEANIIEGNGLVHVTNLPDTIYYETGGPPAR